MKNLVLAALLFVSPVAFAEGEGSSWGAEDVIAAGGLTTVVGGCKDARVVGSGENQEIVYTGPCNMAPTSERRYIRSDYFRVFKTQVEAEANCNRKDIVTGSYSWRGEFRGFVCHEINDSIGGGVGGGN